jgi:hypothetical protein
LPLRSIVSPSRKLYTRSVTKPLVRYLSLTLILVLVSDPTWAAFRVFTQDDTRPVQASSLFNEQALSGRIASAVFAGRSPNAPSHGVVHRLFEGWMDWIPALASGTPRKTPYQFDTWRPDSTARMKLITDGGYNPDPSLWKLLRDFEADLATFAEVLDDLVLHDPLGESPKQIAKACKMSLVRLDELRMGFDSPSGKEINDIATAFQLDPDDVFPRHSAFVGARKQLAQAELLLLVGDRSQLHKRGAWNAALEAAEAHPGDITAVAQAAKIDETQLRKVLEKYPALAGLFGASVSPPAADPETEVESDRGLARTGLMRRIRDRSQILAISKQYGVPFNQVVSLAKRHHLGYGQVNNLLAIVRASPGLEIPEAMRQLALLRSSDGMGYRTTYDAVIALSGITSLVRDLRRDFGFGKLSVSTELVPHLTQLYIALGDYEDSDVMNDVVSELYKLKYIFPEWSNRKVFLRSLRILVRLSKKGKLIPDAMELIQNIRDALSELDVLSAEAHERSMRYFAMRTPNYTVLADEWYTLFESRLTHGSKRYDGYLEESGPEEKLASATVDAKNKKAKKRKVLPYFRAESVTAVQAILNSDASISEKIVQLDALIASPQQTAAQLILAILHRVALDESVPIQVTFQSFNSTRSFPEFASKLEGDDGGHIFVHPQFYRYVERELRSRPTEFDGVQRISLKRIRADYLRSHLYGASLHEIRGHLKAGRKKFGRPAAERIAVEHSGRRWLIVNQGAKLWHVLRRLKPNPVVLASRQALKSYLFDTAKLHDEFAYLRRQGYADRVAEQIVLIDKAFNERPHEVPLYRPTERPAAREISDIGSVALPTATQEDLEKLVRAIPVGNESQVRIAADRLRSLVTSRDSSHSIPPVQTDVRTGLSCLALRAGVNYVIDADLLSVRSPSNALSRMIGHRLENSFAADAAPFPESAVVALTTDALYFAQRPTEERRDILNDLAELESMGWDTRTYTKMLSVVEHALRTWKKAVPKQHVQWTPVTAVTSRADWLEKSDPKLAAIMAAPGVDLRSLDVEGEDWLRAAILRTLLQRKAISFQGVLETIPAYQRRTAEEMHYAVPITASRILNYFTFGASLRRAARILGTLPQTLTHFLIRSRGLGRALLMPQKMAGRKEQRLIALRQLLSLMVDDVSSVFAKFPLDPAILSVMFEVAKHERSLDHFALGAELLGQEALTQLATSTPPRGERSFRQGAWMDIARLGMLVEGRGVPVVKVMSALRVLAEGGKKEMADLPLSDLQDVIRVWKLLGSDSEDVERTPATDLLMNRIVRAFARWEWDATHKLPHDLTLAIAQLGHRGVLSMRAADRSFLYPRMRGIVDSDVMSFALKDAGSSKGWHSVFEGPETGFAVDRRRRAALRYLTSITHEETLVRSAGVMTEVLRAHGSSEYRRTYALEIEDTLQRILGPMPPDDARKTRYTEAHRNLLSALLKEDVAKAFKLENLSPAWKPVADVILSRLARLSIADRQAIIRSTFPPGTDYPRALFFGPLSPEVRQMIETSFEFDWLAESLVHEDVDAVVLPIFRFPKTYRLELLRALAAKDPDFRRDLGTRMEFLRYQFDPTTVRMAFRDDQEGTLFPNYYAVLGVPKDATQDEIAERVRVIAKALAKDYIWGTQNPAAQARMRIFNEARELLRNPEKKREYDRRIPNNPNFYPTRGDAVYMVSTSRKPEGPGVANMLGRVIPWMWNVHRPVIFASLGLAGSVAVQASIPWIVVWSVATVLTMFHSDLKPVHVPRGVRLSPLLYLAAA